MARTKLTFAKLAAALTLCAGLLCAWPLSAWAQTVPADGSYSVEVELGGGGGKSTVESPATLLVENGSMTATIVWSSSNYDLMVVDGVEYLPVTLDGGSTFQIPVTALDETLPVSAETVAMSTPHLIDYTLTFDSASLADADAADASQATQSAQQAASGENPKETELLDDRPTQSDDADPALIVGGVALAVVVVAAIATAALRKRNQ